MSRTSLEDVEYEKIKEHILNPDSSPLDPQQQQQLNRVVAASKILDISPRVKYTVDILRAKFKGLSIAQAYRDVNFARRIFNSDHKFEWEFWHNWLLDDIAKTIERCRNMNPPDNATITKCHANLIKALGEKPTEGIDPALIEKNTFVIPIQINNTNVNIDMKKWLKLDPMLKDEFAKALYGNNEINDIQAEEIMNS